MTHQPAITVLIIDDDEDDRFFMQQAFLTDSPYTQVHLAVGGQPALDLLDSTRSLPDVVLLDLNMPGMDGFEVLSHLKQSARYQSLPVVILTTSDAGEDKERARRLGATEFIDMVLKIRTRNFFNFVYHEPIPTTKTKVYRRV